MSREHTWWLWGVLDALYLGWYAINSIINHRIPYFSDVGSALEILQEHSDVQIYMFLLSMVLQVSLIVSCVLFLLQKEQVKWVVCLQAPFRLIFVLPSVSLFFIGARFFPDYNLALMALLVVASEIVKVWSVWRWSKK